MQGKDLFLRTRLRTRYVLLAIAALWGLTWSLGATSAHFQRSEVVVCFMAALFLLCVAVLVRVFMDGQVGNGGDWICHF